jgi:hypothetical protein
MKRVPERRGFNPLSLLDGYLGHHGFRVLSAPTHSLAIGTRDCAKKSQKTPPGCV